MNVSIYLRVSTEDQAQRATIENQFEFAKKYCDLHELNVIDYYKEDGVSGTIPLHERPEGKRLIEDAKNKKFETLLLYKLDRLGRSARITLNSIFELEGYGVQIKSMTEPFDTSSPSGRFMITMLAGVADLERETILERMWLGANRAAKSGKWLGGITPYGYFVNDQGFLEVNEEPIANFHMSEAEVVRLIYSLLIDHHYSTIKIADYLNALGVPPAYTKDGRQIKKGTRKENTAGIWRPARIRGLVSNTVYMGVHYYGKRSTKERELISREVPSIVSKEIWEEAQRVMKNNQIEAFKNSKRPYLLRGLVKCNDCKCTYQGTGFPGAKRIIKAYYVCGGKGKYNGPLLGKCVSKNLPADWLEDLVWNDIVNFINNPGEAINELQGSLEDRKDNIENLLKEKEIVSNAINDKQNERQSILDLFRKKIISSTDVEQQLTKINDETISLQARLKSLEEQMHNEVNFEQQFNNAEELLMSLKDKMDNELDFDQRREIVKILVKEVLVTTLPSSKTGGRARATVTVHYNFAKDVIHTDNRANNNLDIVIIKENFLPIYNVDFELNSPGKRLRAARMDKQLSIAELAEASGLSTVTISKAELDKINMQPNNIKLLSIILERPVFYLGCYESFPDKTFGQRLIKARLFHGQTKKEFALDIGIDVHTLRDWESDIRLPSNKYFDLLEKRLSILNEEGA